MSYTFRNISSVTQVDMSVVSISGAAANIGNSAFMVAGGYNASWSTQSDVQIVEGFTETAGAPLHKAMASMLLIKLQSGKVARMGGLWSGTKLNTVSIYDPGLDAWTNDTSTMPAPLCDMAGCLLPDGGVLVCGGDDGATGSTSAKVYKWTPDADPYAAGTWTELTPMPRELYGHVCGVVDGKVIVAGGVHLDYNMDQSFNRQTYQYDIALDAWTDITAADFTQDLYDETTNPYPFAVEGAAYASTGTELVMIGGDFRYWGGTLRSNKIRIFSAGAWSTVAVDFPVAIKYASAVFLLPGWLAVVGGSTSGGASEDVYTLLGEEAEDPPVVTASPDTNVVYTSQQTVVLSSTAVGGAIYYTTDGTTPTTSSAEYIDGITISTPTTIKAMAVTATGTQGLVYEFAYDVRVLLFCKITGTMLDAEGDPLGQTVQTITRDNAGNMVVTESWRGETVTLTPQTNVDLLGFIISRSPVEVSTDDTGYFEADVVRGVTVALSSRAISGAIIIDTTGKSAVDLSEYI